MRKHCVLLLVLLVAACADSLTEPSPPIPSVAGLYSGTISPAFYGSATTSVTQSGATVTIEPLQVSAGACTVSIPFGQTRIDHTGAFPAQSGTFSCRQCLYTYGVTGGFGEHDLQVSLNASTGSALDQYDFPVDGCFDWHLNFNLTRQ